MSFKKQQNMLPVFMLIDTSGSMSGTKIEQVKTAIEEIKLQLNVLNDELDDIDLKISILSFDMESRWVAKYNNPFEIKTELELGVLTNMGSAFEELNQALARGKISAENDYYELIKCPVIILLTDGCATDEVDIPLQKLKSNRWFLQSYRLAFAIGEDTDPECMKKFTGSEKTVLSIDDVSVIGEILPKVTRSLSVVSGYSKNVDYNISNNDEQFVESAKKTEQAISDALDDKHRDVYNQKTYMRGSSSISNNDLEWNTDNFKEWI